MKQSRFGTFANAEKERDLLQSQLQEAQAIANEVQAEADMDRHQSSAIVTKLTAELKEALEENTKLKDEIRGWHPHGLSLIVDQLKAEVARLQGEYKQHWDAQERIVEEIRAKLSMRECQLEACKHQIVQMFKYPINKSYIRKWWVKNKLGLLDSALEAANEKGET